MTRALLEQAFEAWFDMQYEKDPDRSSLSSRDGWNAAIEYLAQQERKHTENDVKDLMFWRDKSSKGAFETLVRHILGVPAP